MKTSPRKKSRRKNASSIVRWERKKMPPWAGQCWILFVISRWLCAAAARSRSRWHRGYLASHFLIGLSEKILVTIWATLATMGYLKGLMGVDVRLMHAGEEKGCSCSLVADPTVIIRWRVCVLFVSLLRRHRWNGILPL